jgi:hypothetical protein
MSLSNWNRTLKMYTYNLSDEAVNKEYAFGGNITATPYKFQSVQVIRQ